MEILSSGELANLTNREADVAIRVVYDRKTLPLNLHGLKGPDLFGGVYISRDRLAAWRAGASDPIRWIVISMHGIPDWASEGEVRTTGAPFRVTDAMAEIAAVRQGARDHDIPVFRRRCRSAPGESAGYRPAHARNALASYTRGDTQDEAREALYRVLIPKARRLRAASRGTVGIARLTFGGRGNPIDHVSSCIWIRSS
jgi:hypothetical protein